MAARPRSAIHCEARRAETTEVLAALQRAGRRTPPALMVRPEDALQSLRTAMLLGAVVPEMRARAERLIGDLGNLVSIRKETAEQKERLLADRDSLTNDQRRLAALVDERQRKQSEAEKEVEAERRRAAELSKQAENLRDLIAKMEQDLRTAAKAAAAAAAAAKIAEAKPNAKNTAALKDPGRLSPAIAFASAKGLLPMPVNGPKLRNFGSSDGTGGVERGISVAARPGAQVTTPCDGWVVYSGPFRSYGQLLILNAGGGYHVLLAGMERISVNIGQFVLTGEPVGTMGTRLLRLPRFWRRLPVSRFSISSFARTTLLSIQAHGGPQVKAKRFADDAQSFPGSSQCRRRCRGHAARDAAAGHADRLVGARGRLRHLSPAQSVRRRVRAGSHRLRREAERLEAGRIGDQRHAAGSRSAFELHGRQELPRHDRDDARRVRRPRHRSDDGRRPGEGRLADRRHAGVEGRHSRQRPDRAARRRERAGPDAQSGGREDARPRQHQDQAEGDPQGPGQAARDHADAREHPRASGACAHRTGRHRLYPRHLVQRADDGRPEARNRQPAERDRRQAEGLHHRPAQQPRRIAGGSGDRLRRVPRARRDRLHARPQHRRDPAPQPPSPAT